jgi:hypothetical protein
MSMVLKRTHHRLGHLNLAGTMLVVGMRLCDEAVRPKDFIHDRLER